MTVWTDNAAMVATTRDVWLRQQINAVLADLDAAVRDADDLAGMVTLIDLAAVKLERLGAA